MPRLARWLLSRPARSGPVRPLRPLEPLEDRLVPAGPPAYAVGAGAGHAPEVRVFDAGGRPVRSFLAYEEAFTGGVRVALADLTGDGVADLAAAPGPGRPPLVRVFDGATGELRAEFLAFEPGFGGGVTVAAGDIGAGERGWRSGRTPGAGRGCGRSPPPGSRGGTSSPTRRRSPAGCGWPSAGGRTGTPNW